MYKKATNFFKQKLRLCRGSILTGGVCLVCKRTLAINTVEGAHIYQDASREVCHCPDCEGVRQQDFSIEQFRTIVMLCCNCHRCYDNLNLRFEKDETQFDMYQMVARYKFIKSQIGTTLLAEFEKAKGTINRGNFVALYDSILKQYASIRMSNFVS